MSKSNGTRLIAGALLYAGAIVSALCFAASQAGCVTQSVQSAQVTYTQSCAAYGGAFDVLVALRKADKLNQSQIDQITLIDSQITPLCIGPMPQDLDAATAQVTAAITTLTVLEAIKP